MNRRVVLSLNPDLSAILRNSYVFFMKTAFGRVLIEVARFLIDSAVFRACIDSGKKGVGFCDGLPSVRICRAHREFIHSHMFTIPLPAL
jgi:hypothetical protein